MNWLDDVLRETAEAESPEQYIFWSALAAISATVRDKVWLNKGGLYRLYPNIYIFLIGKSGLRKGFPVSMAKNLVEDLQITRVIGGRVSIQGVLKELSTAQSTENGHIITDASAFLATGEFASFIIEDPAAVYVMTDLHDTHAHEKGWTNTLASESKRRLERPCITFLGASNEINLAETLPKVAHGGGLIARSFLVFADKKRRINSLMKESAPVNYGLLREHLKTLSKVSGAFKMTPEAVALYDSWYTEKELALDVPGAEDPTGTLQRIHDQVLKVAMLLSLSESTSLTLEVKHVQEALDKARDCVPAIKRLMMGSGKETIISGQTKLVVRKILSSPEHELSRRKLLSAGWPEYDAFDLDRIIETMVEAAWIKVSKRGGEVYYKMQDVAINYFKGAM